MDVRKRKKLITAAALILVTAFFLALSVPVAKKLVSCVREPDAFREWVAANGAFGMLRYAALCFIQVVIAFIPGEPLEILGGYAFGAVLGSVLCLAGQFAGSVLVFLAVRKYRMRLFRVFFSEEKANGLRFFRETRGKDVLFMLIFALPGSPKDLLCYYAGLTDMSFPVFLIACSLGRVPAVLTSTLGGSALGSGRYKIAAIAFGVTAALSLSGLFAYNAFLKRRGRKLYPDAKKNDEKEVR